MNATVVVLLVCSVLGLASACCAPAQWEGQQTGIAGTARGSRHEIILMDKVVSYDAINNRTAVLVYLREGTTTRKAKIITIYNTSSSGNVYQLDYTTGKCFVYDVKTPFHRACVPAEAKPVEKFSLGFSGALNATFYEIPAENVKTSLSVQELGNNVCVPVTEAVYGRAGQVAVVETILFTNITSGIKNTTVFDIPEQCKKIDESTLNELLFWDHYIMAI